MNAPVCGLVSRLSPAQASSINVLLFAPSGELLVGGCGYAHTVQIWSYKGGGPKAVLHGHSDHVVSLAFSLDGRFLLSGGLDGRLLLIDMEGLSVVGEIHVGLGAIRGIAFIAQDVFIISCGKGIVSTWSVRSLTEVNRKMISNISINALAVDSARSHIALACGDGIIRMLSLPSQDHSSQLIGHEGSVNSIQFNYDGRIIASGGSDETVRLWNAEDGVAICTLAPSEDAVESISFHPTAPLLASGVLRGEYPITIWDLERRSSTSIADSKLDEVSSICFSPNAHLLACAGNGRTSEVEVWGIDVRS